MSIKIMLKKYTFILLPKFWDCSCTKAIKNQNIASEYQTGMIEVLIVMNITIMDIITITMETTTMAIITMDTTIMDTIIMGIIMDMGMGITIMDIMGSRSMSIISTWK